MAPILSATGDGFTSTDTSFDVAGNTVTIAFDAGSGTDRLLIAACQWFNGTAVTVAAPTYAGVSMTQFGAAVTQGSVRKQMFYLVAPATGSNNFVVDPSAGFSAPQAAVVDLACFTGVSQSAPFTDYVTANGADASAPLDSALTLTGSSAGLLFASHTALGNGVSGATPSNLSAANGNTPNFLDSGTQDIGTFFGTAADAASVATTVTWTGLVALNYVAMGARLAPNGATVAVTGTLASGTKTQANLVSGDDGLGNPLTIILTLTGDTWVAAGATFDAIRDDIIAGLDAASSPATGWNTLVRDALAVTAVVRTSATVVTITIPAVPTYLISADEVITCTIPAAALTGGVEITASPTLTIHYGVRLSAYSGTTNASGIKTTDLTSDQASVRVLTTAYVNGAVVARTTTFPA